MEGKTSTGFKYKVADGIDDDMEFLDALIDLDEGNISGIRHVINKLVGEDGRKALYEHCRKNGKVSMKSVMEEVRYILDNLPKEAKN